MDWRPILALGGLLVVLAVYVWRARSSSEVNQRFAVFTLTLAFWVVGIAGVHSTHYPEFWGRSTFASASFFPATSLAFARAFPESGVWRSTRLSRILAAAGIILAVLSMTTDWIAFDFVILPDRTLKRQPGVLFPVFSVYLVGSIMAILGLLVRKWQRARGLARVQLRYCVLGLLILATGAITTNLLVPAITRRSTSSILGPYFAFAFVALIAHAIIRHRFMDVRLAIHRGLTLTVAILISLAPVLAILAFFWPRLSHHLAPDELVGLLLGMIAISLLIPPIRDITGRLLDTYVYRTRTNYQRTVREASRALTRVLDLKTVLLFVSRPVVASMQAEGTGVYLQDETGFALAIGEPRHEKTAFRLPDRAPEVIGAALRTLKEPLVTDELGREALTDDQRRLYEVLIAHNWALLLPLLSEDAALGVVVVGPKLSGDPFFPHDLDLLMTLANQAGIAIKNAQLYTQVVLANEYVRNIVATIQSGVIAVDAVGRVTMINPAAERLSGLSAEQIHGVAATSLPDPLASSLLRTVRDGAASTEPEITLPGPTTGHPVMCTTSPLHDAAGAVVGAVAVFSDLTPLKQLENERRRAERLAYFEMFAPSIAHEIKNPLVAIKTFAQLVPRRHHEPRFREDFSRVVTREIARIERLLDRLRTMSRSTDRLPQRLDIRAPIVDAAEFLQASFDEKRIGLGLDLGDEPRFVIGDHGEIEQLFINLLINGLEATPPEGSVVITLLGTEVQVAVTVSDTGPGIPAEAVEQVFEPFFSTRQRGSGLGLTICAAIAASHRAKLRAENRHGSGAVFTVEFPVVAAIEAPIRK